MDSLLVCKVILLASVLAMDTSTGVTMTTTEYITSSSRESTIPRDESTSEPSRLPTSEAADNSTSDSTIRSTGSTTTDLTTEPTSISRASTTVVPTSSIMSSSSSIPSTEPITNITTTQTEKVAELPFNYTAAGAALGVFAAVLLVADVAIAVAIYRRVKQTGCEHDINDNEERVNTDVNPYTVESSVDINPYAVESSVDINPYTVESSVDINPYAVESSVDINPASNDIDMYETTRRYNPNVVDTCEGCYEQLQQNRTQYVDDVDVVTATQDRKYSGKYVNI